ncbi:MAG: hypothetical protein ACFFD8_04000 [Candidatus Thorarchaeota archaeon]
MSRRQRKAKKQKKKRLEQLPEKLQRKRERQERYKPRRMPGWIRTSLVVVLLVVIIVGAGIIWFGFLPPIPEPEPTPGEVDILQQDMFYVFINENGQIQIDYMRGRYSGGTYGWNQPLNVSIIRSFNEAEVNFTFPDPNVFYDRWGNAYHVAPRIEANSFEYYVNNIFPNFEFGDETISLEGGSQMRGWYSLFWEYYLYSSNNTFLKQDNLEDVFTFTFAIQPENDTLPYNTPTIVHCNITVKTLPTGGNVFNSGISKLIFPKQVYNDTVLLANITIHEVLRIGSNTNAGQNPTINNETHIGFEALPITVSMSQNATWGYIFDLNVTSFTNESFCLLNLATPENEFFMQSGFTGNVEEQPMHFPKAAIDILTPFSDRLKRNITDFYISFPQVFTENGTISFVVPPEHPSHQLHLIPRPTTETEQIGLNHSLNALPTHSKNQSVFCLIPLNYKFRSWLEQLLNLV